MAYDPTLDTPLDRLRFQLGDTDSAAELLPDGTYTAVLTAQAALSDDDAVIERGAALALLDGLIAKFAQMPSKVANDKGASVEWRDRLEAWKALRVRLLADAAAAVDLATVAPLTSVTVAVRPRW